MGKWISIIPITTIGPFICGLRWLQFGNKAVGTNLEQGFGSINIFYLGLSLVI